MYPLKPPKGLQICKQAGIVVTARTLLKLGSKRYIAASVTTLVLPQGRTKTWTYQPPVAPKMVAKLLPGLVAIPPVLLKLGRARLVVVSVTDRVTTDIRVQTS